MALFGNKKEDSLSLVYGNLKGVDNYVGTRIKIRLNDDSKCLDIVNDDVSKGLTELKIQYSNLYSVSRYSERALPTVLSDGKSEFIFITKINYVENGELKSLTVEEPLLSSLSKRVNFTKEIINRVPNEKPKINKNLDNSKHAIEAIKGLKELLDMGAITEEEFNIKKKELLNI